MAGAKHAHAPGVVLASIHRYGWEQVAPFVESLRATGYDGDICFFATHTSDATVADLETRGITVERVAYSSRKMKNRFVYTWALLRWLPLQWRARALEAVCNFTILRFLRYQHFLTEHRDRYGAALLSDVRDVWFQTNPFAHPLASAANLYEEAQTVASNPANAEWIRKAYGRPTLQRIGGHPIICSGTVMGSPDGLLRLIAHFKTATLQAGRISSMGIDQGIMNYAARTDCPADVKIHANGTAEVLTMGLMPETDIRCDTQGRVVRPDGSIIPILHQYDRHPRFAAQLVSAYRRL